ncbi:TPA: glycosyltransferase [Klebsiella pneumoniae]|nr:glycosyltransferase [Klebsiella pneumoniae]HCG2949722.1 glycosyltransferase [Klebsiella pneumoniae]
MKDVIVVQAVIPDYRVGFFESLSLKKKIKLVFGDCYFEESVVTSSNAFSFRNKHISKNRYLCWRKFLLQTWPSIFRDLFSPSVIVVELNPRCITSWLVLIRSFFLGFGKSVVWGHLLNRKGRLPLLRKIMIFLANGVIFYTNQQSEQFQSIRLSKHTSHGVAPNAVLNASNVVHFDSPGKDFIYVGRLTSAKKAQLLARAFQIALNKLGNDSKLHFVGDGPEVSSLNSWVESHNLSSRIFIHGHISDYEKLKQLYATSIASVSPGYVGLSITQSLSFGRPMIVADNEPHSPEIEALKPGVTGEFFCANSETDLANKLIWFYENRDSWKNKSESISRFCIENYTYESMVDGYVKLIEEVAGG